MKKVLATAILCGLSSCISKDTPKKIVNGVIEQVNIKEDWIGRDGDIYVSIKYEDGSREVQKIREEVDVYMHAYKNFPIGKSVSKTVYLR